MRLSRDFNEFVASFLDHDVQFLVVGGYALAAHGLPRYTGDLDVWIALNPNNAANVLEALSAFGFGDVGLTLDDFLEPDRVTQLGYPPLRIDILNSIEGVTFDQSWERRMDVELDTLVVPFIGREDLIANKRRANRPQDVADVIRLIDGNNPSEPDDGHQ
jgi:Nucleotidyl transferase of unknown function (DUF2204)